MDHTHTAEWRCSQCSTLLGVHNHRAIHIKHKRAQLIVRGHVTAVCHRCAALNETHSHHSAQAR